MLDQYLQQLFAPDQPEPGGDAPPPGLLDRLKGIMAGGAAGAPPPGNGGSMPANAAPMSGNAPSPIAAALAGNASNAPLPPPRPENLGAPQPGMAPAGPGPGMPPAPMVPPPMGGGMPSPMAAALAGQGQGPGASPPQAVPNPMAPPPGGSAPAPGGMLSRLMGRMNGWQPGGGTAVPTPADQPDNASGLVGRLLGMTDPNEKRLSTALAGGFAGGNPAFKGGAFMKGASGSLSGGLKSDKEDTDAASSDTDKAQKQANFERQQTEKEKTDEALRGLYKSRGDALTTKANQPAGAGKSSWNKPASERWKDAQRLIIDKQKQLYGGINPLGPKADRDAAKASADKEMGDFKSQTYKQYGFGDDGSDLADTPQGGAGGGAAKPAVPSSKKVIGDEEGKASGLYPKGTYDDPATPASQEEFDAIPAGTIFKNPADGRLMTKRG